uniref:histidine kinase n=1 Tax=Schlesneria paludicola TaxID=360056 RepID=A0A7C2JXZ2_9PLAN
MEPVNTSVVQTWRRVWRWLQPRGLPDNRELARRAQRVLGFTLALIGFCPLFFGIFLAVGARVCAAVVLLAMAVLVLNVWALRRTGNVRRAAQTMVVTAWLTYTLLGWQQGGHDAPALVWYATLPIMSVVLISRRAGLLAWGVGAVLTTAFFVALECGYAIPSELSPAGMRLVEYTGALGLMLCTLVLTATFDIMERSAEQKLAAALKQAETADRVKSEFLANMSHEIRTPLNAILGFTDLMIDRAVDPADLPDVLQTIKRNGEHLLSIISEILDLSKIEAGQMTVERLPCDPTALVQDVLQILRVRAEPKGLELILQIEGVLPRWIVTDPTRFKQILLNLVGNAIKFTERGRVTVRLQWQANAAQLQCAVIDTGIGMTDEQRRNLFRPFNQADTSVTRRFGGTGLGLVISQKLAELLNGTISVQSECGQGTTFTLTLERVQALQDADSFQPAAEGSAVSEPAAPPEVRRILIADDMPDNRRLMGYLLGKTGVKCETVEDGAAAVAAVSAAATPFDLILMDMQMPVMDGLQAARELRERGFRQPIIAVTADDSPIERDRCLAAGCNDFISKPVQRDQLGRLLARWSSPESAGAERSPAATIHNA